MYKRQGHDRDLHAGLDTAFQVDVLVQVHVRPKVDQLDTGVFAADTVDPAKPLDDAHRVPVDVIVDEVVTVLQVLALADACLLYTSPSPRDRQKSRMPSSA